MREEFGIHELAVEDLSHPHKRPKLEDYPDQVLLIVYGAEVDESTGRASLHEVDIIAGKGWALTFHGAGRWTARSSRAVSAATRSCSSPVPASCCT
jgi:magnesium transporter